MLLMQSTGSVPSPIGGSTSHAFYMPAYFKKKKRRRKEKKLQHLAKPLNPYSQRPV